MERWARRTCPRRQEASAAGRGDVGAIGCAVLAGVGQGEPRSDTEQGRVSIPAGEGIKLLLEAARRFQEAGIALDDLGIRRPTLDEAFLSLTGAGSPEAEAGQ